MSFERTQEKDKKKSFKKLNKLPTRTKYFEIQIGFQGLQSVTFNTFKVTTAFLHENKFPTQKKIENVFRNLTMIDRGNGVQIDKVFGKLRVDSQSNLPYWHILLQTTILTTKKKLKKSFLEPFKLDNALSFDVEAFFNKDDWHNAKVQCQLPSAAENLNLEFDYRPGYFSDQTLLFVSLLEKKEIERYMEDQGNKKN